MVPGFLMATLNPGRKTRRRRHGGKLTAWQRAVKKHGGVMQAVRARRAGKKSRRGRKRRNPFLTAHAVKTAFMANARKRKTHRRRSAVSRRRLRSRSRRSHGRRPTMARRTRRRHRRHRMPGRGRGGRFVSRRSRRRRRNPVVPVSWNPGRRRRRRSRSRRRNPLFLSRKGFSRRKHKGYRRLHRRRHSPRYWHNPVVPVSWNPRRRRRRHVSRRRRHYRRNSPVLPFMAFNPGGSGDLLGSIQKHAMSLIDVKFWTETGAPAAVGFFGSKALGGLLHQYTLTQFAGITPTSAAYPYTKALADTVAGAVMAWATGRFYNKKAGDAVWLGTVVNVAYSIIRQVMLQFAPGVAASIGLAGLGSDLSDRMKQAVTERVRASLGSYLTVDAMRRNTARPMGTYMTVDSLKPATTYDPSPRGDLRDYDPANTETAL